MSVLSEGTETCVFILSLRKPKTPFKITELRRAVADSMETGRAETVHLAAISNETELTAVGTSSSRELIFNSNIRQRHYKHH